MASIIVQSEGERPKSITTVCWRIPEELKKFCEQRAERLTTPTRKVSAAAVAKDLLEIGIISTVGPSVDAYNLIALERIFIEKPCHTYAVNVLPLSDPHARVLENRGCN